MRMFSRVSDAATQGSWEGLLSMSWMIGNSFVQVDQSLTGFENQKDRIELFEKLGFLRPHYLINMISKEAYERELNAIEMAMNERLFIARAAAAKHKPVEDKPPSRRSSGTRSFSSERVTSGIDVDAIPGYMSDTSDTNEIEILLTGI